MLQHFLKAWKNNRGNLLLTLGGIAGLLMCLVWYFQLVPEIRLVSRSLSGTLVSKSQRLDQCPLVATLRIPILRTVDLETPEVDLECIVELYIAQETLRADLAPLFSRPVTLRNDGTPQAVVFNEVQPGTYAVLAYIDLNSNGKFDFDESLKALEPFRLSRGPLAATQDPKQPPKPFDLEQAGVEVIIGQTTLVEFDFRPSNKQAAPL